VRFEQAQALRRAYIALAAGKHDYDGRRVKAMQAIRAALGRLDGFILKNGTGPLKSATRRGDAALHKADAAGWKGKPHEAQAVSDGLLREAEQIMRGLRPGLASDKQHDVLKDVDVALRDLNGALKIR
jgi:hypothetical protein